MIDEKCSQDQNEPRSLMEGYKKKTDFDLRILLKPRPTPDFELAVNTLRRIQEIIVFQSSLVHSPKTRLRKHTTI